MEAIDRTALHLFLHHVHNLCARGAWRKLDASCGLCLCLPAASRSVACLSGWA